MQKRALLIFAKEPRPGKSKTRMTPPLTPDQAAALSSAFIGDTLTAASQVDEADVYLFYTPPAGLPRFQKMIPEGIRLVLQEGADLRERCIHSVSFSFDQGYERIVQIGTDTPQIRSEHIREAFALLNDCDMVLGPANDGGYYLLALSRPEIALFGGVEMGTERVCTKMLAHAETLGLSIRLLPEWIDADTFEDLRLLNGDTEHRLGEKTRHYLAFLNPTA